MRHLNLLLATSALAFAAEPTPAPKATPPTPAKASVPKAAPAARPATSPAAKATPAPKPPRKPEDAVTPAVKNPERHTDFLARIQQGPAGLLFLGDSITDGWNRRGEWSWMKFAPYQPANFGISGDRTEHVLWRITNGELDGIDPKLVVIMIGTNNIGQNADEKPEWAAAGVKKIVETVREKLPRAKVLLLGVFPRGLADSPQRKAVNEINAIISQLGDGKTVHYLDIGKVFLDASGEIPDDVMPDKLHPNPRGYALWYDAIAKPVAGLMSGKSAAAPAPAKTKAAKKKK